MAYSIIAPKAAEAFLIHAEGNEPDNANAATVLSQLESAADMGAMLIGADKALALKDMANSMLKDMSQYGVEGRENVTDDLSLTVKMTDSLLGDANGDGAVNVADIVEMINQGHVDDNDMIRIITIIMSPH